VDIAIIAEFVPILVLNACVMILLIIGLLTCVQTITVVQIPKVICFVPPIPSTKIAITWVSVTRMDKPAYALTQLTENPKIVVSIGTPLLKLRPLRFQVDLQLFQRAIPAQSRVFNHHAIPVHNQPQNQASVPLLPVW
jgi:hypothetical protein